MKRGIICCPIRIIDNDTMPQHKRLDNSFVGFGVVFAVYYAYTLGI